MAMAIWYLHSPLPALKVTAYTQITHDGGLSIDIIHVPPYEFDYGEYEHSLQIRRR